MTTTTRRYLLVITLGILCARGAGARDPSVEVRIGDPTVWTLTQAHYLLSRMHARTQDLSTKTPTADELDPNAVHGERLEVLSSFFGLSAGYDRASRLTNRLTLDRYRQDQSRRAELEALIRHRQQEQLDVIRAAAPLQIELARLEETEGADEAEIAALHAEVAALDAEKGVIEEEVTYLKEKLDGISSTPPELEEPTLEPVPGVPPGKLENLLETVTTSLGNPKLHASAKLENHIQMQYELIAKQLTLLRDETDPDEQLLFLELPYSFYTVPKKSDGYLAQITWRVAGIGRLMTDCLGLADYLKQLQDRLKELNDRKGNVLDDLAAGQRKLVRLDPAKDDVDLDVAAVEKEIEAAEHRSQTVADEIIDLKTAIGHTKTEHLQRCKKGNGDNQANGQSKAQKEPRPSGEGAIELKDIVTAYKYAKSNKGQKVAIETIQPFEEPAEASASPLLVFEAPEDLGRRVRVVDLIPRKSALNVTDKHYVSRARGFTGFFTSYLGFGAKTSYQRQRENYDQFLQQEVFASGFGKGDQLYGWTFGPQPGTKRIAPGPRTTYAVIAVPRDTAVIEIEAEACTYPRKHLPPVPFQGGEASGRRTHCYGEESTQEPGKTQPKTSIIGVPVPASSGSTLSGFWIEEVGYQTVPAGEPVTVVLRGKRFSPQLGVLVDGVPLRRAVSVARADFGHVSSAESGATQATPRGAFEIVNSETLMMVFSMGAEFEGTPAITLTSPFKTFEINSFYVQVRVAGSADADKGGCSRCSLKEKSLEHPMFRKGLALDGTQIRLASTTEAEGVLEGAGLRKGLDVLLNGESIGSCADTSTSSLCVLDPFSSRLADAKWTFSVLRSSARGAEDASFGPIDNPLLPKVDLGKSEIVNYLEEAGKPAVATIRLRGSGFHQATEVDTVPGGNMAAGTEILSPEEILVVAKVASEPILIKVTNPSGSTVASFNRPVAPSVDKITSEKTGEAKGSETGGYRVSITGSYLHNVTHVFFGTAEATALKTGPRALQVTAPPGEGKVQVRLDTDFVYRGKPLNNLQDFVTKPDAVTFTYTEPPKEEKSEENDKKDG